MLKVILYYIIITVGPEPRARKPHDRRFQGIRLQVGSSLAPEIEKKMMRK